MVLPLLTTNRLSVSIVILVVLTTMACSDLPSLRQLLRIERIVDDSVLKSLQFTSQYFSVSFKMGFGAADATVYNGLKGNSRGRFKGGGDCGRLRLRLIDPE
jgi:hypothetical protein